jgi:hypothetical protein
MSEADARMGIDNLDHLQKQGRNRVSSSHFWGRELSNWAS